MNDSTRAFRGKPVTDLSKYSSPEETKLPYLLTVLVAAVLCCDGIQMVNATRAHLRNARDTQTAGITHDPDSTKRLPF